MRNMIDQIIRLLDHCAVGNVSSLLKTGYQAVFAMGRPKQARWPHEYSRALAVWPELA